MTSEALAARVRVRSGRKDMHSRAASVRPIPYTCVSSPERSRFRVWPVSGFRRGPCDRPLEEPLAVKLFPADRVTWVVSLPTGLAGDTIWPDMEWIEALAPVLGEAEDDPAETRPCEEVRAR